MAKKDITLLTRAADELLSTDLPPRQRQILENYRRHAILEVTCEWQGIFEPDMTVEHPVYYFNMTGMEGLTLDGAAAVQAVYAKLAADDTSVMLVEAERIAVADWGFASDSIFNTYVRGSDAHSRGISVDNVDGYYILRQHLAMIWPYDEQCRLIGERVYENIALQEVVEIPEEDFITLAEARERLLPLLRPLSVFAA